MTVEHVSEHKIGPFSYGEATAHIQEFGKALVNLKLQHRFSVHSVPQSVGHGFYQVVLYDKQPDLPKPEGLTVLDIRKAQAAGYKKPRTTYYNAFGQRMTLGAWAEATGVSRQTLKARLDTGMTIEEAITDVALKRAA